MKSISVKSADEALKRFNNNHGEVIETTEDLTPNAKLARGLILTIRHPEEISLNNNQGDFEIF